MRYLLKLSYDGTLYHGWQIQPNAVTVQGVLHEAMSEIFAESIETAGCGRTDAGVHASKFYAHFDIDGVMPENFLRRANFLLPPDIRLIDLIKVSDDFHARFDALSRSYEYLLNFTPNPFLHKYALLLYRQPDFEAMNKAAVHLLNYKSFGCFGKTGADNRTDFCKISEAVWKPHEENIWKFHITSDRFLRGMVRAIVGTLLDVGFGKLTEAQFIKILEGNDRTKAGESVEAKGLFLCDVKYEGVK